jgi:hypothetical protein
MRDYTRFLDGTVIALLDCVGSFPDLSVVKRKLGGNSYGFGCEFEKSGVRVGWSNYGGDVSDRFGADADCC